jgi:nitrogen-specific signal transduction histidine kinase
MELHPCVLCIVRDITDRRRLEEAVRLSQQRLAQTQKLDAIGSLAGGVAHDFNNVLSVILSHSAMIIAGLKAGDPLLAELEAIRIAAERAADLTRQLLAFGRQQILKPQSLSLNDVLMRMEPFLRRLIGEDVELTIKCAEKLGTALLDPTQMEQVVMNLVANSRDAMPRGGQLTIETANVDLDESYAANSADVRPGPHVLLAVTDTGTGMSRETKSRIFEPFFSTKERGRGTGLGLATVFGIVKQSSGHIWVYSELGKGTTFKAYFPRSDQADPEAVPGGSSRAQKQVPLDGNETILLVEDDEQVRAVAARILRQHGYRVLPAESGSRALLVAENHPTTIHLLLTDVIMPLMSGRELAERLRRLRPAIKVLYMSGYTDNSIVHHGILDSDVEFLQKPIRPAALLRKLRQVLDG